MRLLNHQRKLLLSIKKFYNSSFLLEDSVILGSNTGFFCNYSSRRRPDVSDIPELNEPPLKKFYEAYYQTDTGRVYDKKPFKIKCTKGKTYYWCSCGWSHDQPLCDGKCTLPEMKIKMKPVAFKPGENREYWFCNCKHTKNRPFCDGSHLSEVVQSAPSVILRR
ncbi:hypothetical protein TNIN_295491 [Trichonephila inaurata madagascariensis]|uniref:Iron-binding zinc finger CDGSH type domain-containing protein n=1 Tax=Trichonephila inaurata madagascariensis TaxID=2747483 RepID=A0A8X7BYM6_9ARAC|nr:hypothetical protein TNIN_295491 [Trichonephila inaurata madagascariensis]